MIDSNESICYKNSFLSSIICRIDFNEPLPEEVINNIVKDKEINRSFPVRVKDQIKKRENHKCFS